MVAECKLLNTKECVDLLFDFLDIYRIQMIVTRCQPRPGARESPGMKLFYQKFNEKF